MVRLLPGRKQPTARTSAVSVPCMPSGYGPCHRQYDDRGVFQAVIKSPHCAGCWRAWLAARSADRRWSRVQTSPTADSGTGSMSMWSFLLASRSSSSASIRLITSGGGIVPVPMPRTSSPALRSTEPGSRTPATPTSRGQLAVDWREALSVIARSTRDTLLRHPWAVQALQGRGAAAQDGPFGPNGLRHFEQSLAAVAGTGLATRMNIG